MGKSTLLSVRQAANRLGYSPQYLYTLIQKKQIQAEEIGGYWMIEAAEVDRFAQEKEQSGKREAVPAGANC